VFGSPGLELLDRLGRRGQLGAARADGRALGEGTSPEGAILAVLLCAPLALLGRRADRLVELWNERLAARAESELSRHHARAAVRTNLYGLVLPFSIAAVLAPAGAAAAGVAVPAFLRAIPSARLPLRVGFFAFAALAGASGAKALRAKTAPVLFFAGLAAAVIGAAVLGRLAA
jgi:PTS system mannose-specific IIC component